MADHTHSELVTFYTKLALETASGIRNKVLAANGMPLTPTTGVGLRHIPVYEGEPDYKCSLLTQANEGRKNTTIAWPAAQEFEYLPAYYKKYKVDGKITNKIVVNTGNYCYARFFAAKELMHCFIDDDGIHASNSIPLVNELIESLTVNWGAAEEIRPQRIVDEVAYLGAVEYLIPSEWVPLLIKIKDQIALTSQEGTNSFLHVAQLLRVPENILRIRLRAPLPS
jgi:hypothetical protein